MSDDFESFRAIRRQALELIEKLYKEGHDGHDIAKALISAVAMDFNDSVKKDEPRYYKLLFELQDELIR